MMQIGFLAKIYRNLFFFPSPPSGGRVEVADSRKKGKRERIGDSEEETLIFKLVHHWSWLVL